MTRYPLYRRWVGPRADLNGCKKFRTHKGFLFFRSLYFIYTTYLPWLSWLCLLSLLCNTHNTNIHAPGEIRTRNARKRVAADPRLRPLGNWDRQIRSLDLPARSEPLYRLSYRPTTRTRCMKKKWLRKSLKDCKQVEKVDRIRLRE